MFQLLPAVPSARPGLACQGQHFEPVSSSILTLSAGLGLCSPPKHLLNEGAITWPGVRLTNSPYTFGCNFNKNQEVHIEGDLIQGALLRLCLSYSIII